MRNAQKVCHVLLRHLLPAVQPEAEEHDFAFPLPQLFQRLFEELLLRIGFQAAVHALRRRAQDVGKEEFVAFEIGVERLVEGDFAFQPRRPPEIHENFVLDAAGGIGGEFYVPVGAEGIDRLDQPDRADGDEIVRIDARIVELAGYVHDQAEVVLDEFRAHFVPLFAPVEFSQHLLFLFGSEGQGQRLRPADIVHRLFRVHLP